MSPSVTGRAQVGLAVTLLLAALPCLSAEPKRRTVRFWGEVAQGLEFRKNIGRGLDLVLSPDKMGGGITGWTIQVSPQGQSPTSECRDFAWVVTPPFRFQNALYLDTSYGTPAQEAVAISPREFNFVLSCEDYKTEYERVEKVLWPYNYSQEAMEEARARLGTIPHGTGRLWIRDSKYTAADKTTDPVKLGEIHCIRFEVKINFPADANQ
ncbi:MAG: hypothetical protein LAO07_03075 [Acidobacteriia bacterium]|nr:hypothetical protein [Terriglobia bacterium]